jgi:beta-glucosidase
VAASHKEAVKLAIDAGIDLVIVPFDYSFTKDLIALVKEGEISEKRIDESVKRILVLKEKVGLFQNPHIEKEAFDNFGRPEYAQTALKCAEESVTLLKNTNAILPLNASSKVSLLGPTANSLPCLHGAWTYTWQGQKSQFFDPKTLTLSQALADSFKVTYIDGISFENKDNMPSILSKIPANQIVIYALGEDAYAETPGNISSLDLDPSHLEIIKAIKNKGNKVVLVLLQGRPRIIREIEPFCDAIVLGYLPGSQGAMALANVLYGKVNPSGKLAFTYPRYASERITYDHKTLDEAVEVAEPYSYTFQFKPQFEFGFGLSYTTFSYSDLKLSKTKLKEKDTLEISVKVSNTGKIDGKEVVELYLKDDYATLTPCVKRLKRFEKITLKAGESKTVRFQLTEKDLAYIHENKKLTADKGTFILMVGDLKAGFELE